MLAVGSDDFQPESLVAGEIGYRIQPSPLFSFDATVFAHHISDLRSQELPPTGLPVVVGNTLEGDVRGVEVGVNVAAGRPGGGRTSATRGWIRRSGVRRAAAMSAAASTEANDPDQFFGLRSSLDLPHRIEVDAMLRAVAALPNPAVPSYAELNLRVGWWATAARRSVGRRPGSAARPPS